MQIYRKKRINKLYFSFIYKFKFYFRYFHAKEQFNEYHVRMEKFLILKFKKIVK